MKEKTESIINFYGLNNQQRKLEEEIFELQEAIINNENSFSEKGIMLIDEISEEMADVLVILKQMQYYFKIKDEDIEKNMNYKINRQTKRIEEMIKKGRSNKWNMNLKK